MLPFKPEPNEQLQARYAAAVMITYVAAPNMKNRPGENPENVFDFQDGIRLIVSKDLILEKEILHFSGSIHTQDFIGKKYDSSHYKQFVQKFVYLSQLKNVRFRLAGESPEGIPHFYVEQMPKANVFNLEHQWQLYMQRVKMNEATFPPMQVKETKQAFYGACGQMLVLLREDIAALSEDEGIKKLEDLSDQVMKYFHSLTKQG